MGTPIIPLLIGGIGGVPSGVFIFKGGIRVPSDFPTPLQVKNGWTYIILPLSVTSVTRIGSTATITTASPHGWSTGTVITVSGADQPEYNGSYSITVTGANTATYTITGTPVTPATGTIEARPNVVTDNDPTRTNTGQTFKDEDIIAWNGTNWTDITGVEVWIDTGLDVRLINAKAVNLQNFGLIDTNVTTELKLGDASNTIYTTDNKTIIGSGNELTDRLFTGLQHPTGFPNRTDSEILYNPATRQITVQPKAPATSFDYYLKSVKKTISSPQSLTHPATTGIYFFYWDASNTLQFTTSFWNIITDVLISYVIYNQSLTDGFHNEERHSSYRNPAVHAELHEQIGTYKIDGFAISGYIVQPATPTDADNTFALALGNIADEDIRLQLPALADGGPYTLFYRSGAAGTWLWNKTATLPFFTGTTYIQYNQFTGSTWQLTELANNQYVNIWVFKVPALDGNFQTVMVIGQNVHATLAGAIAETVESIQWGTIPFEEIVGIWKVTYRTSASYTSTGQCRVERQPEELVGSRAILIGTTQTNHNALTGLQGAAAGVTWGHINDQVQQIAGAKTFEAKADYLTHPTIIADTDIIDKKFFDDNLPTQGSDQFLNPSLGKITFVLSNTPIDATKTEGFRNGNKALYGINFTVSGNTVTWITPTIQTTDDLEFVYNKAAVGGARSILIPVEPNNNLSGHRNRSISGTGAFIFEFTAPFEMVGNPTEVSFISSPATGAAGPGKDIDLTLTYGNQTELITANVVSNTTNTYDLGAVNTFTKLNVTFLFTGVTAGDTCGLEVDHNGIGGANFYYNILFKYIT